jgi:hypothetical protein
MTPTSDEVRYRRAWRSLTLRRVAAFGLLLAYLPAMEVIAFKLSDGSERSVRIAALAWMACLVVAVIWLGLFRCPRCRRLFGTSWWFNNPLAGRCLRCRLPMGTGPDA